MTPGRRLSRGGAGASGGIGDAMQIGFLDEDGLRVAGDAPRKGIRNSERHAEGQNSNRIGAADGMQDFTMSLKKLVEDEMVDRNTAFSVAPNQDALKMALKGIGVRAPSII